MQSRDHRGTTVLITFPLYCKAPYDIDFIKENVARAKEVFSGLRVAARKPEVNVLFKVEFQLCLVPINLQFQSEGTIEKLARDQKFLEFSEVLSTFIDDDDEGSFTIRQFTMTDQYKAYLDAARIRDEQHLNLPSRIGGEIVDLIKIHCMVHGDKKIGHLVLDTTADISSYDDLLRALQSKNLQFYLARYAENEIWSVVNKAIFIPTVERLDARDCAREMNRNFKSKMLDIFKTTLRDLNGMKRDRNENSILMYNKVFLWTLRNIDIVDENFNFKFEKIETHFLITKSIVPNKSQTWKHQSNVLEEHSLPTIAVARCKNDVGVDVVITKSHAAALVRKYSANRLSGKAQRDTFEGAIYKPQFELQCAVMFFSLFKRWLNELESRRDARSNATIVRALQNFESSVVPNWSAFFKTRMIPQSPTPKAIAKKSPEEHPVETSSPEVI